MPVVHVLNGGGLDAAVRAIQRQAVLWYPNVGARDADLRVPWDGATTVYVAAGQLVLETWAAGQWWRIFPTSGGGGLDLPTADARFVNVTGDSMTGQLAMQQPLRWLASPDTLDVRYDSAARGLAFFRSGDTGDVLALDTVLRRVTVYGAPVMTKLRWQATAALAAASWAAAGWVQMPLTARNDPGALVHANYVTLPDVGYYTAQANVAGMDRAITGQVELLLRVAGTSSVDVVDVLWPGVAGKLTYSASAAAFYNASPGAQLQFQCFMPHAMAVAPSAAGAVVVSSLF